MTRMLQQIARLTALLLGLTFTSAALAVATVEVTTTGLIQDDTTLQLDNIVGDNRYVVDKDKRTITLPAGIYTARVLVRGLPIGDATTVKLAEGPNRLEYDSSGKVTVPSGRPTTAFPKISVPGFPTIGPSGFGVSVGPGFVTDKTPPAIGANTATDTRLLEASKTIYTAGAYVQTQLEKDLEDACTWGIGESSGDRSTSTQVPVGTPMGWTYFRPVGDSTGVSGMVGGNASLKTEFQEWHFNVGLPSQPLRDYGEWKLSGEPKLGFQYSKFKYHGDISLAVPGVSSAQDQSVRENDLSFGYGVGAQHALSNQFWIKSGIGAYVAAYWAKYGGTQNNLCGVCSMPVQNFSISSSDKRNGLTLGGWVDATVGYAVTKTFDVFLSGSYRFNQNSATLVSKDIPSQPEPHLDIDHREFANLQFGLRWKF